MEICMTPLGLNKTISCPTFFPSSASVSAGLPQDKGQDPHNLRHPWYQASQDEPGPPQRCMAPSANNLFNWCSHFYSCRLMELNNMFYSHHYFSLLIIVVVQREIQQYKRPADLHAHYTPADALLPRQWDHQRGMVKRDIRLTDFHKINVKVLFKMFAEIILCF